MCKLKYTLVDTRFIGIYGRNWLKIILDFTLLDVNFI